MITNELATSFFRFSEQGSPLTGVAHTLGVFQTYPGPVLIELENRGTATCDFFSTDTTDNQEPLQTEALH